MLRCSACETPLKLAVTPKPGQRVRCPKCKEVFTVPEPDVQEPELVDDEELDEEPVRPSKKKRRAKDADYAEERKGIPHVVWYVLAGVVIIAAVAGLKIAGYLDFSGGDGIKLGVGKEAKSHEEILKQQTAIYKAQSYHFRRIHSENDAKKRLPRLKELNQELQDCIAKEKQLGPRDNVKLRDAYLEMTDARAAANDDRAEAEKEAGVQSVLGSQ